MSLASSVSGALGKGQMCRVWKTWPGSAPEWFCFCGSQILFRFAPFLILNSGSNAKCNLLDNRIESRVTISTVTTIGHGQALVRIDTHLRAGAATRDSWCGQQLTPGTGGSWISQGRIQGCGGGGREHCREGLWKWLFTNLHENLLVFHLVKP